MPRARETPIVKLVQKEFKSKADADKAVEMAAYMKTAMPFYGVQKPDRIPIYKLLKKEFPAQSHEQYVDNVRALWQLPHREEKYAALEYACMFPQYINVESLELYAQLIESGAWWDFVDVVAINLVGHAYLKERLKMKGTIDRWSGAKDMWVRRSSLICHNHHKAQTDREQLFATCLKLSHEKEFFIRKAIGWALREYSYVDGKGVKKFLNDNRDTLSPLSFREGAKGLIRSGLMK
ncbi:MAG TPA: DNA alkylation repair protein [Planktothrix sp.]|jgi:3-methyladenine DNA glycosylase AlkD